MGRTENDGDQLVHLSCSIPLSNGWHGCIVGCCFDSGWLLLFRHHFQVRRGTSDLPDLQCEVKKGGLVSMKRVALRPSSIIFGSGICSVSILAYPFRNFSSRLEARSRLDFYIFRLLLSSRFRRSECVSSRK